MISSSIFCFQNLRLVSHETSFLFWLRSGRQTSPHIIPRSCGSRDALQLNMLYMSSSDAMFRRIDQKKWAFSKSMRDCTMSFSTEFMKRLYARILAQIRLSISKFIYLNHCVGISHRCWTRTTIVLFLSSSTYYSTPRRDVLSWAGNQAHCLRPNLAVHNGEKASAYAVEGSKCGDWLSNCRETSLISSRWLLKRLKYTTAYENGPALNRGRKSGPMPQKTTLQPLLQASTRRGLALVRKTP